MRYSLPRDTWYETDDLSHLYIYQVPTQQQCYDLKLLWSDCDQIYVERIESFLEAEGYPDIADLPIEIYWKLYYAAVEHIESMNQGE